MERCKSCVADLLGACSEDFCRAEREALREEAERRARERGHTLGKFVKAEGCPVWQAQCTRCGRPVTIRLDPVPGEADIDGEAVSSPCPSSGDEPIAAGTGKSGG